MRIVSILVLLLSCTIVLSQVLVGVNGKFTSLQEKDGFVEVKPLEAIGASLVISEKSGRAYLIYGKKITILEKSGTVSIDFLDIFPNGALYTGDKIMIRIDLLSKIFNVDRYETATGKTVLLDNLCVLKSIDLSRNELKLSFLGFPFEDMMKITTEKSKIRIVLSPCLSSFSSTDRIKIDQVGNKTDIEINFDIEAEPSVSLKMEDNSAILAVRFPQISREILAEGVSWEQKVEKIGGKDVLVSYLWIDPTIVELRPQISAGGIGTAESVERMVSRNNAIAGINASYFDPNTGLPIGLLIVDGKILSLPYGNRPVFVQTKSGAVVVARMYFDLNVRIGQLLFLVKGVNTIAQGEVLIFTPEFGLSIPRRDGMIYFSVVGGKISGFGWSAKAPKDGYVLAISSNYERYLQSIQIGDKVDYVVNTDFPYSIKHAVEAGPLILYNGTPIPDRNDEKNRYGGNIARSNATRTLLATLADGKVVLAVINDQNGSGGVNYDDLVEFCMNKGFYSAMNFDGGSSSVMVIRDQVVSKTSTAWTRAIPVSLLVIKNNK
ncbi:phosphodiester glycosidase family protein [Pseudothermotoga sp. U03pept]|uniref:phosphodiester glycosidase family protein n=1 Tax=Pseudothermotoga sp. U03pept TaxID=3447012 RepID=UPI003F00F817